MPKEKAKIRVRIRKSHTGGPYPEVSYNAPHAIMFATNQSSLFQRPAIRTGLLIAAAIIALIAAALIVTPFGSQEDQVTAEREDADAPLSSAVEPSDEALSTGEDNLDPSFETFVYQSPASPPPFAEPEVPAPSAEEFQPPPPPETVTEQPSADTSPLETRAPEEEGNATQDAEPEQIIEEHEPSTSAQVSQFPLQDAEPEELSAVTQPNDVFAPQPSVTPEPSASEAPVPAAEPTEEAVEVPLGPAPETAQAEAVPPADEPEQSSTIARAQFARDVVDREPVDPVDSIFYASGTETDRIYYFTELVGLKGATIRHRWEYQGEVIATVVFDVGGDRWRVYSRKTLLPSMTGQWRVIVLDAEDNVLQADEFTYAARDS